MKKQNNNNKHYYNCKLKYLSLSINLINHFLNVINILKNVIQILYLCLILLLLLLLFLPENVFIFFKNAVKILVELREIYNGLCVLWFLYDYFQWSVNNWLAHGFPFFIKLLELDLLEELSLVKYGPSHVVDVLFVPDWLASNC